MTLHETEVMFDTYYDHYIDEVTGLLDIKSDDEIAMETAKKLAKETVEAMAKIEERKRIAMGGKR